MDPGFILRMRLTWLTSTVMPKSLKEPVWLLPHCLTHKSVIPRVSRPKRSAQNRLELPSNMLTMSSSEIPCEHKGVTEGNETLQDCSGGSRRLPVKEINPGGGTQPTYRQDPLLLAPNA